LSPIRIKARHFAVGAVLAGLTALPVRAESLQQRLPICFDCHGENGQSQRPEVPSLGAQQAMYSLIELVMFRDKLRIAEPMNEMVTGLSDDELRTASEIIAKSPAPEPTSDARDPARAERGRMLAEQNRCNVCHQPNFQGLDNVPRIASQRLPAQGITWLQEQFAPRLRRADVGSHLSDERRRFRRSRVFPCTYQMSNC
jgi:cytochrome c553